MEQPAGLPLSPGTVVAGKYRIEGVLGVGGMATVFSAWHDELEQRVALKMLHASSGADPTTVKRFIREARNAARIQSEHVARIFDVGRVEDGRVYIVMEYLEGNDLSRALKLRGPLPVTEVVEYLVQACDAIAVAHSMGIVHRDLKPANLFVTRRIDGSVCVKVLDFGIAKAHDAPEGGELTLTTSFVGSPVYTAPEQMTNARDVDRRADVWSLGVIAYRLLSAQLPYRGENLVSLAMAIASKAPVPLREHRADIPTELDAAIMRCLQRDRDLRWPDVGAFVEALLPLAPASAQTLGRRVLRIAEAARAQPSSVAPPASGDFEVVPIDVPLQEASSPTLGTLGGPLAPPSAATIPPVPEPRPPRRRTALFLVAFVIAGGGVGVAASMLRGRTVTTAASEEQAAPPSPSAAPSVSAAATEIDKVEAPAASTSASTVSAPAASTVHAPAAATPKHKTQPVLKKGSGSPKKPGDPWGWGE